MSEIGEEERKEMRATLARLLDRHYREGGVRRAMERGEPHNAILWSAIVEAGLTGVIVDPQYGGIGGGAVEAEAIMEEAGAALLAGPLFSTAILAAGLLNKADEAVQQRLLPALVAGEVIGTVAFTGDAGTWTNEGVAVNACNRDDGWRLDGVASFVTAAPSAHLLLIVARTDEGLAVFEVDAAAPGVAVTDLSTFDMTLRLGRITLSSVAGQRIAGIEAIDRTLDLARVALAGEQVGAARRIFGITIDYLKTRVQFGRPIGGFQALKHMAADLLLELESATSAARAAARAVDADAKDRAALVNLAAFTCAEAFEQVASQAIQMHGGIAFTWEHQAHLFWRRARADAFLFGSPELHRDRYVDAMEAAE